MLLYFSLIFIFSAILKFDKKLLNILMLEGCMLFLVSSCYLGVFGSSESLASVSLILMIFLVVDSVLGLSSLSCNSRLSILYSPSLSHF